MIYPLISEYTEAILSAEDNFNELAHLRPVLDENGNPIMSNGNFAVVYKMQDPNSGKYYAVKCFPRDQESRSQSYREICKVMSSISSSYIVSFNYLERELFVDSSQTDEAEFPVLIMDWIDGIPLDKYIEQYKGNPFVLYELCYNFRLLAKWLLDQDFAHGDLKPDNILVQENGNIVLIDYDGIFVPSMSGQKSRKGGTPEYRNPFFTAEFDEHMDDFSLAIIALSLKLISISYDIQSKYSEGNGLLFSLRDYIDFHESRLFRFIINEMKTEPILGQYLATFIKTISGNKLRGSDFDFPEERELDNLLDFYNGDDIDRKRKKEGIETKDGLIYSKDGFYLIGINEEKCFEGQKKSIREGTIAICEQALNTNTPKIQLQFPSTLRYFSPKSLNYRYTNISWDSPWFTFSNGFILTQDKTECILQLWKEAHFDKNIKIIGANVFWLLNFKNKLSRNLKRIRREAFEESGIEGTVIFPEGLVEIGNWCFRNCKINKVYLPESLNIIGRGCFSDCRELTKIEMEKCNIRTIPAHTFEYTQIRDVKFPKNVNRLGSNAFCGTKIKKLFFPDKIREIDEFAFSFIDTLENITFLGEIDIIKQNAFSYCNNLKTLNYNSIKKIEKNAFKDCPLQLYITDSIEEIEPGAITGSKIMNCYSTNFFIENEILYSKKQNELIYSWINSDIIEIKDGIMKLSGTEFLFKPKVLVFPDSFDGSLIDNINISDIKIVPSYFKECYKFRHPHNIFYEKVYIDSHGIFYSKDKLKLLLFPVNVDIETYKVLDECIEIGDNAFEFIEEFDPETGGFCLYSKLKKLILPLNLIKIGEDAINCPEITNLEIPPHTKIIEAGALSGCPNLIKLLIPSSVEKIGFNAFPTNTKLKFESDKFRIYNDYLFAWRDGIDELLSMPFKPHRLELPKEIIYKGLECLTYDKCIVTKKGKLIWVIPDIKHFEFPPSVKIIGKKTFFHNDQISLLFIPEGVTEIERDAFHSNQNLKDIYLPSSIVKIHTLKIYHNMNTGRAFYPDRIHIPKGMKPYFISLLPDIPINTLIEDYECFDYEPSII